MFGNEFPMFFFSSSWMDGNDEPPQCSFPAISQHFWTVRDLQRSSCVVNFNDFMLDKGSSAALDLK